MSEPTPPKRRLVRLLLRRWWAAYALLLGASYGWREGRDEPRHPDDPSVSVPAMADAGPVAGLSMRMAYREWRVDEVVPGDGDAASGGGHRSPEADETLPVVLIHGSPGSAGNFSALGPLIALDGRRVVAPDLPGFGESEPDPPSLSMLAHARAVLALMDALSIERAHVVGWSLGGGVGLHVADLAPRRVASLTLLASVGEQEAEGSGSNAVEHAKYAAGWLAASAMIDLVPHFGLLDGLEAARASMRNFRDSDQRPLRGIMERLATPTLILHGRRDFLVRWWAAERSHELIAPSRLVMLDAGHFLPFLQPDEAAEHLLPFFARHDDAGAGAIRQSADLAPRHAMFGDAEEWFGDALRTTPWWILAALAAALTWGGGRWGPAVIALVVATGRLDFGVGVVGMLAGQSAGALAARGRGRAVRGPVVGSGINARGVEEWRCAIAERPVRTALAARFVPGAFEAAWRGLGALGSRARSEPGAPLRADARLLFVLGSAAAALLWSAYALVSAEVAYSLVVPPLVDELGWAGFSAAAGVVLLTPGVTSLLVTGTGRRVLRMRLGRAARREFWPALALYLPLVPHILRLSIRHRGVLVFTACNPGIPSGGGVIGESKKAILDAMPDEAVLPAVLIPPDADPARRARLALEAIRDRADLGSWPVVLKPDSGYRGFAVRLARGERDVREYLERMTAPALVQRYHPGPCECGVLWARRVAPGGDRGDMTGFIFSVCRKDFPLLIGDGRRTLEDLIWSHPRFRFQAGVFLERWARERRRVPGAGERVRLAEAGNHCQGTLFRDGADLITPALERRIDAIARRFGARRDGPGLLDIGRFDLRYESDELLRAGRGFAVIELNGTTGESTNIYDPDRSALWAYGVLARQWTLMYELGAKRREAGGRPATLGELIAQARHHFAARSGPALSD